MRAEVFEHEGAKGTYYVVRATCPECGAPVEGRVASSRDGAQVSRAVAGEWVQQLERGEARLCCARCRA